MATELIKVSELPVKTTDFADGDLLIVSEYNGGTYISKSKNAFGLAMPIGAGAEWYAATAPAGWLFQDGSAISRTTYAALFAIIGTTWGVGDGSTTFNLPDKREAASVGIGTRASGVTAHDAFTLAQFKDDQAQDHNHTENVGSSVTAADSNFPTVYRAGQDATGTAINRTNTTQQNTVSIGQAIAGAIGGTPRIGTVTRGKRIGVNFIIKY